MRPFERELGSGVIEAQNRAPTVLGMTGRTTPSAGFEISRAGSVRIAVAGGAFQAGKVEAERLLPLYHLLEVTVRAGDRGMGAGSGKTRFAMQRQRKGGPPEVSGFVAGVAAVLPRSLRELTRVRVFMADPALTRGRAIVGRGARGLVTKCALGGGMLAGQGILRLLVLAQREIGGDEPRLVVAGLAVSAIRTLRKLAIVAVAMTVQASGVRHRRMKVGGLVALEAGHRGVLAAQRILGLVVGKGPQVGHNLPPVGAVAALAALRKSAFVGILVARRTVGEGQSGVFCILRIFIGRLVALDASHSLVQTR